MTAGAPEAERRRPRRERRRRRRARAALRWLLRLVAVGLAFFVGLAVGRAVEETPRPGGTQRLVRTLEPGTVAPAVETVTVTVSPE